MSAMAVAGIAVLVLSCGDGSVEPAPPPAPVATTVTVNPASATLTALEETVRFTAEVRDQNGQVMAAAPVSWASSDASVAAVDASGQVTAAANGSATITATAGSASGTAAVTVAQVVSAVTVTPAADTLVAFGDTLRLMAEAVDANGHAVGASEFQWASSDTLVAVVDASGLVTAAANGNATVTATAGAASGTTAVTVAQVVAQVAVTPAVDTVVTGDTLRLAAAAVDANGHAVAEASFAWASADSTVARVDDSGLATGVEPGTATITASSGGATGTAQLTVVAPVPTSVTVTPDTATLAALSDTVRLAAEVLDELGRVMPGAEVAWSSANTTVATVNPAGLVTAVGNGSATVTATSGSATGSAAVTVAQVVAEVAVTPAVDTVLTGQTVRLAASAVDANGHAVAEATFTWASGDITVARVDDTGLATGVAPGTAAITAMSDGVTGTARLTVVAPAPSPDRPALVAFYEATGGPNWDEADNWLSDRPVSEWHGVTVNDDRRVTSLVLTSNNLVGPIPAAVGRLSEIEEIGLSFNGLGGSIPADLASLSRLRILRLDSNNLSGAIPAELGAMPELVALVLSQNALSGPIPRELGDLSKLEHLDLRANNLQGPIPPELGQLSLLRLLTLGTNAVTGSIPPQLGELASLEHLDLGINELTGKIPAELFSRTTRLQSLWLGYNRLTGPLPPEIGNLSQLESLALHWTDLTGPLPPELGSLRELKRLRAYHTRITGPLPPELGQMTSLEELLLYNNEITGPIPGEWGGMADLKALLLFGNRLSGQLPPGLGDLEALEWLWVGDNNLRGGVPARFGNMTALTQLDVTDNSRMSGRLPATLTQLGQMEALLAGGTDLCAPGDEAFTSWLGEIWKQRVALCGGPSGSAFLLTQAVQSRSFPVPLVAGEPALLRVFVTSAGAGGARIPPVRARFYSGGNEVHVSEIRGQSRTIPARVIEGDLTRSANAEIPGHVLQPGTEVVIEIDPDGTLDPGLNITRRIPEEGRVKLDVRTMPALDLTVIPFLWAEDPDSSVLEATAGMAADPTGHELLEDTRVLLPVAELEVANHEAVTVSSNHAFDILSATEAIQVIEGGDGHYLGLMAGMVTAAQGVANTPGRSSFSIPSSSTIAHELGHNMNLLHAPCGGAGGPDPAFPNADGSIGSWGYDFSTGALVPPSANDLMGYCQDRWISDFSFSNALRYRLFDEGTSARRTAAAQSVLLLWGGTDPVGQPFLEPAFVLSAPPSLPQADGGHNLVGIGEDGRELFRLSFNMQELSHGDGRSGFAFALPIQPGWAETLAAITLSGPGGSAMLDETTDRPMAILRDPVTRQVRAILRGDPGVAQAAADQAGASGIDPSRFDELLSRGLPDARAWERR